jgi:hypothetical protein
MNKFVTRLIATLPLAENTVVIINGNAEKKRGSVRNILLSELNDMAKKKNITNACIHASASRMKLYGIPDDMKQKIRNIWNANYK